MPMPLEPRTKLLWALTASNPEDQVQEALCSTKVWMVLWSHLETTKVLGSNNQPRAMSKHIRWLAFHAWDRCYCSCSECTMKGCGRRQNRTGKLTSVCTRQQYWAETLILISRDNSKVVLKRKMRYFSDICSIWMAKACQKWLFMLACDLLEGSQPESLDTSKAESSEWITVGCVSKPDTCAHLPTAGIAASF